MPIDPSNFLSYSVWLSLPFDIRYKVAEKFGIKPSVPRHTVDSRVISDGFSPDSLSVITKEKLREFTGLEGDDFYALFNAFVDQIINPVAIKKETPDVQQEEQIKTDAGAETPRAKKTGGRKPKGKNN